MLTVLCVLVATAPFAVVFGLLAWTNRQARRRREVQARQITLTDGVHKRLGAVAAPLVSRRRGGWQVWMAVPFERPGMTGALVAIVLEVFAPRDKNRRTLEIILTPQADQSATKADGRRGVGRESLLSWT